MHKSSTDEQCYQTAQSSKRSVLDRRNDIFAHVPRSIALINKQKNVGYHADLQMSQASEAREHIIRKRCNVIPSKTPSARSITNT